MIEINAIKKNLKEIIKTSGLTQTEIANRIGIKQQSVNQYLTGKALPSLDTFANLCKLLEVDANEILCLK